jgi:hypothetical protein
MRTSQGRREMNEALGCVHQGTIDAGRRPAPLYKLELERGNIADLFELRLVTGDCLYEL